MRASARASRYFGSCRFAATLLRPPHAGAKLTQSVSSQIAICSQGCSHFASQKHGYLYRHGTSHCAKRSSTPNDRHLSAQFCSFHDSQQLSFDHAHQRREEQICTSGDNPRQSPMRSCAVVQLCSCAVGSRQQSLSFCGRLCPGSGLIRRSPKSDAVSYAFLKSMQMKREVCFRPLPHGRLYFPAHHIPMIVKQPFSEYSIAARINTPRSGFVP